MRSKYRQNLKRLLLHVRIWPLDLDIGILYGEIYHELESVHQSAIHFHAVALVKDGAEVMNRAE